MTIRVYGSDRCSSCKEWRRTLTQVVEEGDVIQYMDVDKINGRPTGIPFTEFIDKDGSVVGSVLGGMSIDIAKRDIDIYRRRCDDKGGA